MEKTVPRQCHQVPVRATFFQQGECRAHLAARRTADECRGVTAGKGRLSGQDFAEDGAQAEHVGPLVARLAVRLFWRHVTR